MYKIFRVGLVLAMLALPTGVFAATPLDTVEANVSRLLEV